ncbi:MAG TPA: DUF6644 family protein [Caulobacteraceae bacterium]|nr:DUF6644 family protein [Caulobacteraceae bacterium]
MLQTVAQWLQDTALAQWIATSAVGFPWIETFHVIFITTVVGTITVVDLRLLNLTSTRRSVSQITSEVLPFTWCAFALAALTGGLLFMSKATEYVDDFPFRMKMLLLACAGLNMVVFHFTAARGVASWDQGVDTPRAAKIAAALSLLFWTGIIVFGRWIGFTVR